MAVHGPAAVFGPGVAHPPAVAWRVVLKWYVDGLTYREICEHLKPMAVSSAWSIIDRFQRTGSVETHQGQNPLGPPNQIMTADRTTRLLECMLDNEEAGDGDEMLLEIYDAFLAREQVVISISTLCQTLRLHGWTRNRLSHLARHRDALAADRFRQHMVAEYHMALTLWIDESHVDNRSRRRNYGYSLRGMPAVATRGVELRGKRYSVLGMFDLEWGCANYHAVEGSIDSDAFYDMIVEEVVPLMNAFPGRRSVLVLDNCVTHRKQRIVDAVKAKHAIIEFLPPYCPDVAIHERCLRSVKQYLRNMAPLLPPDNMQAIDLALRNVTPTHVREAMLAMGYPHVH